MKQSSRPVSLRIVVVDPPPHVMWALQLGQSEMAKPTTVTRNRVTFEFTVEAVDGDAMNTLRLRGPAVQGRAGDRFVYLRIGTYAGQTGTDVARRAKVRLEGITWDLLVAASARPNAVLEVQFAGTDSKGGAACATVPLLGKGWSVA